MLMVLLFLESLGGGELMVILLFVLIFFGSKNIPSLARGLGKGIREFKDAMNGVQSEIRQGMHEVERQVEQAGTPETRPAKSAEIAKDPAKEEPAAQFSEENKTVITTASFVPPPAAQPRD